MSSLSSFKRNVHSQHGEDGVLGEIVRRLEIGSGEFVEFGAWDGMHLSNTYHLLEQGWRGVYIEGDESRYRDLVRNMEPFADRVQTLQAFVEPDGEQTLDKLLARTQLAREFEVLSVDIDSYDWQVWESLRNYAPKIVIIEINSGIPVGIRQTHRGPEVQGSSFTSTLELGIEKGYTAVCHTGNMFFVQNDLVPRLELPRQEIRFPETLFDYTWKRLSYDSDSSRGKKRISRAIGKLRRSTKSPA